jgi:hypothetical protein
MWNGRTRAWWLLMSLAGCGSPLPKEVRPTGSVHEDLSFLENADQIAYRQLTRADFKATRPPPQMNEYAKRVGALTCVYVLLSEDTSSWTEPRGSHFESRMTRLGFIARMDRNCSWWNPAGNLPEAYVLQHEQIHFAMVETETRRLQARVPELISELRASGPSLKASQQDMQKQLLNLVQEALERILDRSLEFDEDTSGKHAVELQQRWYQDVMRELQLMGG